MTSAEIRFRQNRIRSFLEYLPNLLYPLEAEMRLTVTTDPDPIPFESLSTREFRKISEGEVWGRDWSSAWFRIEGRVPQEWTGKTVVARLNFAGEACVFSEAGEPLQGLTSGSIFNLGFVRERFRLFEPAAGGEPVRLWVEAAANDLFGLSRDAHPIPNRPYNEGFEGRVRLARLCVFDEELHHLQLDVFLLERLMHSLPERAPLRARLLHVLDRAVSAFRYDRPNPAELRSLLAPALKLHGDGARLATRAVGHAHIDTAWLWPIRETVRKCARTFSTQLRLIERYPDYVFGASQAQLYAFVKQHYPGLFERIRSAVRAGRWEIQGAMWVEADCNVPSGESLVRQVLYGKRFFREEFGVDVRNLWLPDVFGYSAALPQILRQAGVDSFLTQKISWSQFNSFPHHTFIWKGIDGTPILTHFPPEDTYNSMLEPQRLRYAAENFEEKGTLPGFLTLFGVGDGGGGPKEENVELGLRQRDLAGCTRVEFGPAQPFLDRLREHWDELPEWRGELYLELHRGTLTTQAANKRMNRRLELALRRAELFWSCLSLDQYPADALERMWKTLLTNQFHDIIPGSSIHRVYEDSLREYAAIEKELNALESEATERLRAATENLDDTGAVTVVNTLSLPFNGAVRLPESAPLPEGTAQPDEDGGAWVAVDLPPHGRRVFGAAADGRARVSATTTLSAAEDFLENELIRYEFDADGRLCRVLDKPSGREFMRPGEPGNILSLYQDWPHNWDAWELDLTYREELIETARLVSRRLKAAGPALAILELEWHVGQSALRQEVRLPANSARLDFVTRAEWHECRKMLRVSFPVDVEAREAAFEIQFGLFRRPTHNNTSWDMAQFEVCGHRFADLADADGGVALLNDCKYGYRVKDNVLDLNLLRSPWYPDPEADRGRHEFTYSLFPHTGGTSAAVLAAAHSLNQPPAVIPGRVDAVLPCTVHGACVVLEALKRAEDGTAWVVRLYEPLGRRARCELRPRADVVEVLEAGIMEEARAHLPIQDGRVPLAFRPFEIRTLLLRSAASL
ncbi:MAG: alpha-mannosidase [Kiritimatiellaeota bacterium]|nr:alpha-mannosidase [Kiritimatiellota bacterium]